MISDTHLTEQKETNDGKPDEESRETARTGVHINEGCGQKVQAQYAVCVSFHQDRQGDVQKNRYRDRKTVTVCLAVS